ncbi:MAG: hypothetical protein HY763_11055 [Planctomycetes bacterium]|nr:hypothetical protein [Planctomycetota bacterium]
MSAGVADSKLVEQIVHRGVPLACIIRAGLVPSSTQFMTPESYTQQVGFVVYPAGGRIARHRHRPLKRQLVGTSEVLVVRRGRCEVELWSDSGELAARRELRAGDVLILTAGGHGFHMLDDTVLLEIKQGPYTGLDEKEYF